MRNYKNIKRIKMFENTFLYTAYIDNSTLFLKGRTSVKELSTSINCNQLIFTIFGFKTTLKEVKVTICKMY